VRGRRSGIPGDSFWQVHTQAAGGSVDAVEADAAANRSARRALHDLPQVHLHAADVRTWLSTAPGRPDGVVLDPPRAGAGPAIVDAIAERAVPRVVYVACDPAALARDVALLRAHGYRLAGIEAYDAFPMTHHVETIALLAKTGDSLTYGDA